MSALISNLTVCPVCSQATVKGFMNLPGFPVQHNVLWSSRSDALNAPRGDIQLGFCHTCGHIFNQAFDPAKIDYSQNYENSLHFSGVFQQYASKLAAELIKKYHLFGKHIIEIGSGQGDFLALLCERGGNRGTGFDPSYDPTVGKQGEGLVFIQDYYSDKYARLPVDFICCRQVLEHIYQPSAFLSMLRQVIGNRINTPVFFEVPNVEYTLYQSGIWDILYEHFSYFSPSSLAQVFRRSGFDVKKVVRKFGKQFLTIEAFPAREEVTQKRSEAEDLQSLSSAVGRFASSFEKKVQDWEKRLDQFRQAGQQAVVWGAGTKGVSFLNMLRTEGVINYIVDINPRKIGMYVTGAGQKIISPAFLNELRPDYVILMNQNYRHEIARQLQQLGSAASVFTA